MVNPTSLFFFSYVIGGMSLSSCHKMTNSVSRKKNKQYGVECSGSCSRPAMTCQATGNSNLSVPSHRRPMHGGHSGGNNEEGRSENRYFCFFLFDWELRSRKDTPRADACTHRLTNNANTHIPHCCWLLIISSLCLTVVGDCCGKTHLLQPLFLSSITVIKWQCNTSLSTFS